MSLFDREGKWIEKTKPDTLTVEAHAVLVEEFDKLVEENKALRQKVMELEARLTSYREQELRAKFPRKR